MARIAVALRAVPNRDVDRLQRGDVASNRPFADAEPKRQLGQGVPAPAQRQEHEQRPLKRLISHDAEDRANNVRKQAA